VDGAAVTLGRWKKKIEDKQAGAPSKKRRYRLILSLTLFDIDGLLKRYVGGLVLSMDRTLHIGSLGFRPDDVSVSFTV
jgi:hypothetical protein